MVRTVCLKNFDFASHSDKGKVRTRNEDFLAYFDTINGHVFVICDGMGGHNAGDVASELAVEAVQEYFNANYQQNPFEAVEEAIIYANQIVYQHAVGNDYLEGMGTTIVLALIRDDRVYYGHAGDSRLYLYKNNVLEQMTVDHSHIQQLLDRGMITKKEALKHPQRNEITRALGLSSMFEPEVSPQAIIPEDNDMLILCSDGLSNLLDNNEIINILDNSSNLNDKALKLISKVNKKGGPDNISVQIVKFHNLTGYIETENEIIDSPLTSIRKLLKNSKLSYTLVFLFVLGASFFVGLYESPEIIKTIDPRYKMEDVSFQIIPFKIKPGNSLKYIAERFNTSVKELKRLNPHFENIKPGMHLKVPIRDIHIVEQSDDLTTIVAEYESSIIDIMKANELESLNLLVGSELYIPLKMNKNEETKNTDTFNRLNYR